MPSPTTELLHQGDDRQRHQGAISTPVYRASLFGFASYADFKTAFVNQR